MPTAELERFAAWIRQRASWNANVNAMLYGGFESDDRWRFEDSHTQELWDAWLAGQFFETSATSTEPTEANNVDN